MDNSQRLDNYETQKGLTYLDPEVRMLKLTPKQRKRVRMHAGERGAHAHAPDVFINDKHKHVRVTRCDICRTPVPTSA